MKTSEELELEIEDVIRKMDYFELKQSAEVVRELLVRYKAALITANNYKKALEALDHAK